MHPITTHTGKFFASFFQKRRENYYSKLTYPFYLCAKGQECELHQLERDDAVGDADDSDTASDACEEVTERELPTEKNCPEDVRDYVL